MYLQKLYAAAGRQYACFLQRLRPWLANLMQKTHFWPTLQLVAAFQLVTHVWITSWTLPNWRIIYLIHLAGKPRWVSIYAMWIFTRQKLLGTLNFLFGFMCCKYLLLECLKLSFVAAENRRRVTQSGVNLLFVVWVQLITLFPVCKTKGNSIVEQAHQ